MNYVINVNKEKYEQDIIKNNKSNFDNFKMYENNNVTDYELIIINNAEKLDGLCNYIKSSSKFINKNIKIFLLTNTTLKLIIGPISISSYSDIDIINKYIVHSIKRDYTISNIDVVHDYLKINNINNNIHIFYN